MKYSSTIRLVNVILFALLGVGTGYLGIYFGFIISPNLWPVTLPSGVAIPNMSLALALTLGALGLAGFAVSLFGLFKSVMSLVKRDDELVRSAFGCYIGLGYIIAVFFLLNAVWLYRLLTTNIGFDEIGFAIVIFVILMIVALIASSIPLVKMFGEGEGTNRVMMILTRSLVAIDFAIALEFFLAFLVMNAKVGAMSHADVIVTKFGVYALVPALAAICGGVALFGYYRAEKAHVYKKLNGFLFEGALAINGAAIIVAGILAYVYKDISCAIMAKIPEPAQWGNTEEFAIASYIVGGIIVALAALLCYLTVFPPKVKEQQR